jgi:three-Cys-motif partner protein
MTQHQFGGAWTEEKLTRLKKYLVKYRTILKHYPYFKTWYVDAFAGTGARAIASKSREPSLLDEVYADSERTEYLQGSARIALGLADPFDR